MQKINLRELYPDVYKTDVFVDVAEEVVAAIRGQEQDDAAYERRKFRHKAHYSLTGRMALKTMSSTGTHPGGSPGAEAAAGGSVCRADAADRRRVWESIRRGLKKLARLLDTAQ